MMGGGQKLEELDIRMRKVFQVCRERGIKLSPNKLQCGRRVKFGGMMIEAGRSAGEAENTVYIRPEQRKIDDFLNILTPSSKKEVQMICGTAAQLKQFCPGMQLIYPGMMGLCGPNVKFYWNADLQRELDNLKECLKKHIKLSPIDVKKNLKLIIDAAATVGCSYILVQDKSENSEDGYNFISMDSSNFKKGQLSLCPFEAEVAALRYACRKENHYLRCCPEVTVMTDCKEMISTYAKPQLQVSRHASRCSPISS